MTLVTLILCTIFAAVRAHSPQRLLQQVAPASGSPAVSPAQAPGALKSACPTETFYVDASQLVDLKETQCIQNGSVKGEAVGRFGRNTDFGIKWNDNHTEECTVYTLTIALQPGISCTGGSGNLTLNNKPTTEQYSFPYANEYRNVCACDNPIIARVQVFNIQPGDSYLLGQDNYLRILGSTGANGLRPLIPQGTEGIYAIVIINQWVATSPMNSPRTMFGWTATALGTALAVGGVSTQAQALASSDAYNFTTQSWTASTSNMEVPRQLPEVASLQSSSEKPDASGSYYAIAAGGIDQSNLVRADADLYNTSCNCWTRAPPMQVARARFKLTGIWSGTGAAIATGGLQGFLGDQKALGSAESYDINTNTWQLSNSTMAEARYRHQAVRLPDGNVLVMGGRGNGTQTLRSTEILDINLFQFNTTGSMRDARYAFTATLLNNGSVLVTGGAKFANSDSTWANSDLLTSCEIYTNGTWTPTGSLINARADHQAVLQSDGTVLVAGGGGAVAQTASELWDPRTGIWAPVAPMPVSRVKFGMVGSPSDGVITFGGAPGGEVGLVNGSSTSFLFNKGYNLGELLASRSPAIAPAASPASLAAGDNLVSPATASGSSATQSSGLGPGAIAGIAVGAAVGVAALAILAFLLLRKRRRPAPAGDLIAPTKVSSEAHLPVYKNGQAALDSNSHNAADGQQRSASNASSLLGKLVTPFANIASTPSPHGDFQSKSTIQMPRGLASPFASEETDAEAPVSHRSASARSSSQQRAVSQRSISQQSIELPGGIPSPFASRQNTAPMTQSTLTGGSWDPDTRRTDVSTEKGRVSEEMQSRNALNTRGSQASVKSDLSRVSMAIRNELHGAEWKIERHTLELGKRLGKGGFGEVFEGRHHGSAVAIKVLTIDDNRTMLDACQEFGHLHNLRHSKLVVSYGACVEGSTMMLVMELMQENLFSAIASDHTSAADSVLWNFRGWNIAVDIASALVFLHSKGLVHLDVKSLNILLKGNRTEAKLADLGLAKLVPDGHLALQNTLPGTPAYSAPEVLQAQLQWRLRTQGRKDQFRTEVGTPADIFAFGVVLFELCTGLHPARWQHDFKGTLRPEQAPESIAKLIDDCLNDDPAQRPDARRVLDILLKNKPAHVRI